MILLTCWFQYSVCLLKKSDLEQPRSSMRSLKYDQKSKRYMFSDDALDVKSCSICLEDLGTLVVLLC